MSPSVENYAWIDSAESKMPEFQMLDKYLVLAPRMLFSSSIPSLPRRLASRWHDTTESKLNGSPLCGLSATAGRSTPRQQLTTPRQRLDLFSIHFSDFIVVEPPPFSIFFFPFASL